MRGLRRDSDLDWRPPPSRPVAGRDGRAHCDIGAVEVPEPTRWLLLGAGLGCLVVLHRVGRRG
ncbi:MAG: PEP-CTERM sorting domain-containing protein [Gemmatimonadota bacterium]|nr:MAG: PEP-CTERM sorting domain-containing protein [Gemmatimonadota bacterium]